MGESEHQRAEALSLDRLRPPVLVPGYDSARFLGRGAFGEVWQAVRRTTGQRVAIKFYNRRGQFEWGSLFREVEKLRYLFTDRYVVQLLDVDWDANPPYYVMEYMEKGSLEDLLKEGPLPVAQAVALIREVAQGLVHAHAKGILHCDLKPANILLDQDGRPRLADFGQARLAHEHTPALGTLFYMAPEQADLEGIPDTRWDVYALGAVLYCLLTGTPPHHPNASKTSLADVKKDKKESDALQIQEVLRAATLGEQLARYRRLLREAPSPTAHRRIPDVDGALADIMDRCLAIDPKRRYPNVEAVLTALDARSQSQARRPLLILGVLAPLAVLLVVALFAVYLSDATVSTAEQKLTRHAMESNRFAARTVAERFALDIDRRWEILEYQAAHPELSQRLEALGKTQAKTQAWQSQQAWFQSWIETCHHEIDQRFPKRMQAMSWFVNDHTGLQIARSPLDDSVGQYWAHRDYFHGKGRDYSKRNPELTFKPIRQPHRSIVYRSTVNNKLAVAFSVPIWKEKPGKGEPLGVLAMTSQIGRFAQWEGSPNQFSVLVDVRAGVTERPGMIIEHPLLEQQHRNPDTPASDCYVDDQVLQRAQQLRDRKHQLLLQRMLKDPEPKSNKDVIPANTEDTLDLSEDYQGGYQDPLEPNVPGGWLTTLEPVIVAHRRQVILDSDWLVLVQQKVDNVQAPVRSLRRRLLLGGVVALLVVVAVVAMVWAFVVVILEQASTLPTIRYLRRQLGLASDGTGRFRRKSLAPSVTSTGNSQAGSQSDSQARSAKPGTPTLKEQKNPPT